MKRVKGSSIKLKSDVNISADKVLLKGKKSKTYEELKEPYKDMSKDFERQAYVKTYGKFGSLCRSKDNQKSGWKLWCGLYRCVKPCKK